MTDARADDSLNHSPEALALFAGTMHGDEAMPNALLALAASSSCAGDPNDAAPAVVAIPRGGWAAAEPALLALPRGGIGAVDPDGLGTALLAFPRGGTVAPHRDCVAR